MANDQPTIERLYRVRDGDGSLLGDFHLVSLADDVMTLCCENIDEATTITVDRGLWEVTKEDFCVRPVKIRSVMRERIAPTSTEQTGE